MTKQNAVEKGYDLGHRLACDVLEQCEKQGQDHRPSDIFAGLLTTICHATYFMAPTEEQAEEIFSFAMATALEDWKKEKGEE